MFSKLVHVSDNEVPERIKVQLDGKKAGKYSAALSKGWKEISEKEFAQGEFFTYSFDFKRYHQAQLSPQEPISSIYEFWRNDGSGYAMIRDYWKGNIRYFQIGCDHEFEELSWKGMQEKYPEYVKLFTSGNCCHNTVCKKCKQFRFIDSSD